jgi:very-short-patch-repair endonuclease
MKKNNIKYLITDFNKKHNNKYDYSKCVYVNNRTKMEIICPIHGSFYQSSSVHMKGHGCSYCTKNKKMNNLSFIEKANKKHGLKYDYSLVDYKNNSTAIKIICKKHGPFSQRPSKHLLGQGCYKCGGSMVLSNKDFIEKSILIHGDLYNYDLVEYENAKSKVAIKCKSHGVFYQKPNNHLSGYGCYLCKSSKGELNILKYLSDNNINFIKEYYISDLGYYFDFYLPDHKVAIEYDGIQHHKPIDFFGGKDGYLKTKQRDKLKSDYCKNNNIELIRIPYTDIDKIEINIKSILFL